MVVAVFPFVKRFAGSCSEKWTVIGSWWLFVAMRVMFVELLEGIAVLVMVSDWSGWMMKGMSAVLVVRWPS